MRLVAVDWTHESLVSLVPSLSAALMTRRVVSMIRPSRKPLMQCRDQSWILRSVLNLCAIGQGRVLHIDVPSPCAQCGQPWHIFPMNFGGIGEIALAKLGGLLLEMRVDQGNLRAIRRVFGRDRLPAAIPGVQTRGGVETPLRCTHVASRPRETS